MRIGDEAIQRRLPLHCIARHQSRLSVVDGLQEWRGGGHDAWHANRRGGKAAHGAFRLAEEIVGLEWAEVDVRSCQFGEQIGKRHAGAFFDAADEWCQPGEARQIQLSEDGQRRPRFFCEDPSNSFGRHLEVAMVSEGAAGKN